MEVVFTKHTSLWLKNKETNKRKKNKPNQIENRLEIFGFVNQFFSNATIMI